MNPNDLKGRLVRIYAAFGDVAALSPEEQLHSAAAVGDSLQVWFDWSGGRSEDQLKKDAYAVINEVMGIRDRAKKWMKHKGKQRDAVDELIKNDRHLSLLHDLANYDKHGSHGRETFSGLQPEIINVHGAVTAKRDPVTGKYATAGHVTTKLDLTTGEATPDESEGTEVVITGDVVDGSGNRIELLNDLLFWAILKWEQFLTAEGAL